MFLYTLEDITASGAQALMKKPFEWHCVAPMYQDPRRGYHDIRHIQTLLRDIIALDVSADIKAWLEGVAWLHDAYYDPLMGSPGNEKMSADLLDTSLGEAFTDYGKKLARYTIELTARHSITHSNIEPLAALFLDIDISHLGADYPVFIRNSQLISEEYRHCGVADNVLVEGYHKFFQGMLDRQHLYYTQMYNHREDAARKNLTKGMEESSVLVAAPQLVVFSYPEED